MRQQKSRVEVSWKFFWKWFQRLIITLVVCFFAYGMFIDPIVQVVHESSLKKACELKHNRPCKLAMTAVPE
ncbi:hypothetical protein D3C85_739720 [compost metagenome]